MISANQAPKKDDSDAIPRRLKEALDLADEIKQKKKEILQDRSTIEKTNKKLKGRKAIEKIAISKVLNKSPDEKGSDFPTLRKSVKFEQGKNESDSTFLNRVERVNI